MIRMTRKIVLAAALGALLTLPTASEAGFVPVLVSGAGTNTYTYSLNFTTSAALPETLSAGDFITLYDFDAGVTIGAISAPAGFTTSIQNLGFTAPGGLVNPTDNPGISNITFTYTGATLSADTTFTVTITLPQASATRIGQYTSTDTIAVPLSKNNQIGAVLVPVPEPSSVALLGLGGLGIGLVARRRMVRA